MSWLLLTVAAIISRSVFSLATKNMSSKVQVSSITQSVMFTALSGLLAIPVGLMLGGFNFSSIDQYWVAAAVMIVSQAFGNILFFAGLKKLDAGMAQIAFSSILIWGAILSVVFLDSSFSSIQIAGIVLMLAALVLIQYKKASRRLDPGVLYIIFAAALFALFQVASADLSENVSTGSYLMLAYFGPSVLLGIVYFRTLRKDYQELKIQLRSTSKNTLFASATSVSYFVFSYLAFQSAPDRGVVIVLLTAQVILSVVLGILFLKEKDNMNRKLIAAALAFAASVLIRS